MKQKILALVVVLVCLLSASALAEDYFMLGDTKIYGSGSGMVGGGSYAYDADTRTLMLTDVNMDGGLLLVDEINDGWLDTIVLKGTNFVKGIDAYPLNLTGDITFTGDGSLTVQDASYSITVYYGNLKIDGANVDVSGEGSQVYFPEGHNAKVEICNGGQLTAKSEYVLAKAISGGENTKIRVSGGSKLVIDSRNFTNGRPYDGTLIVEDTSCAEITSVHGGLPEFTQEDAGSVSLTPDKNGGYSLAFNEGSETYRFTVTQTDNGDRNLVKITGSDQLDDGGSDEAVPMPETGDEAMPVLWSIMLLAAAAYFIRRRHANA